MPAPVSVVIPTLDAAAALPETLAALLPGVQAGLIRELVVSDGGSRDETRAVARAVGAEVVEGAPGRGAQIARGVAAARGEWLLILHADTVLAPGWEAAAARHLAERPGRAGVFRLAFRATGWAPRLVAGWANLRTALVRLPFGDQGMLISRTLLAEAGGVPDLPLMEDVALARALGRRIAVLDAVALTSAARYEERGWLRQGGRNLLRQARFLLGADPSRLAAGYVRRRAR